MSSQKPPMPPATESTPRFAAFISYRHVEPDRTWAEWLHAGLEAYRVPSALVRDGIPRRVGRIFRDEEELAASADLSESIDEALRDSRYLIVVCSSRTPESRWVNQEVERFRGLDRSERILALLVEAEPSRSFPPSLCEIRRALVEPDGTSSEEAEVVEPLAADVRPSPHYSPRQAKKLALMRLTATVLGCRFDDLRRRDRERLTRRLIVSGLLVSILSTLLLFAGKRGRQAYLDAERRVRQETAKGLAAYSRNASEDAPILSLILAAEAVHSTTRAGDPPDPEAEERLRSALASTAGRTILRLDPPPLRAALSRGGRRLVTVNQAQRPGIEFWDLDPPAPGPTRLEYDDAALKSGPPGTTITSGSLAISPDGRFVAADFQGGPLWLWDLRRADRPPFLLKADPDGVSGLRFNSDGSRLVACFGPRIHVWNLGGDLASLTDSERDNDLPRSARERELTILATAFHPKDSDVFVTGSNDGNVHLWDLSNPKAKPELVRIAPAIPWDLRFSPDGGNLVVTFDTPDLRILIAGKGELRNSSSASPTFNPEKVELRHVLDYDDMELLLLDRRSRIVSGRGLNAVDGPYWRLRLQHWQDGAILDGKFAADGRHAVAVAVDGTVRRWDRLQPLDEPRDLLATGASDIRLVALSPDAMISAAAKWNTSPEVLLWRNDGGGSRPVARIEGLDAEVSCLTFSPDGRTLAVGSNNGVIRLYDPDLPARAKGRLTGHSDRVLALSFTTDSRRLLSGGLDNTARAWDVITPSAAITVRTTKSAIIAITAGRDGRLAYCVDRDGTAWSWEIDRPEIADRFFSPPTPYHQHGATAAAVSDDGQLVVLGQRDGVMRSWRLGWSREKPLVETRFLGLITSVALHPNGRRVIALNEANSVLCDPLDPSSPHMTLHSSDRSASKSAAFSPDGRRLLTVLGNSCSLWTFDPEELVAKAGAVAGRNLTHDEWQKYFPGQPYRPTFSDQPRPALRYRPRDARVLGEAD